MFEGFVFRKYGQRMTQNLDIRQSVASRRMAAKITAWVSALGQPEAIAAI